MAVKQETTTRRIYRTCGESEIKAAQRIRLIPQMGEEDELNRGNKAMCIMQTLAFVTGQVTKGEIDQRYNSKTGEYEPVIGIVDVTDHPICASEQITDMCISINDCHDGDTPSHMRRLAQLKKALPAIQGTAPIVEKTTIRHLKSGDKVIVTQVTDKSDPAYRAAEKKRKKMIADARQGRGPWGRTKPDDSHYANPGDTLPHDWLMDPGEPMTKKIEFIEELAAVAKFNYPPEDDGNQGAVPGPPDPPQGAGVGMVA